MKFVRSLLERLSREIRMLKDTVAAQKERLSRIEPTRSESLHAMEVRQEGLLQSEELRRDKLSDQDLRLDLEKQYGKTKWAKKLISEMLHTRTKARGG